MQISPIAIRLTNGQDLKKMLAELVNQHQIKAGTIASCVGCLSHLSIRLAGAKGTLNISAPFEIVSLVGTLTPNHLHIHIAVADEKGTVWGGHLLEGNIVDTTAELVLHHYPCLNFGREYDPSTGYSELTIREKAVKRSHRLRAISKFVNIPGYKISD